MGGAKRAISKTVGSIKKTVQDPKRLITKNPAVLGVSALTDKLGLTGSAPKAQVGDISSLSEMERRAGATAPQFESFRDESGALKSQFIYDPTKSGAFSKLQEQAMAAPGQSPWAKMQMEKQALEQQGAQDQLARQQAAAQQQAASALARQGGLGGGARTRMAMQGARDQMLAQQNLARQGMQQRLGIGEQDIGRQQDLLGRVSAAELEAQGKNLGTLGGDIEKKAMFDMERYRQQMQTFGAQRSAQAQERAANNSRKK